MNSRIDQLNRQPYDLLVIGGGIVGAGVARDASLRGLETLLVEQSDFGSGTSSRSSRLLHGGLRCLAQGHIGLVREASREKMVLHRIAPHLTQPLAFLFPTYRGTGLPRWKLWMGTKLYDLLCGRMNFGRSRALSPAQVQEALPDLKTSGLTGAVRYYDALTHDARLVIDTLRSAASHGASLVNYLKLESANRVSDTWQCQLTDQFTGASVEVTARTIVNATGPWSDRIPHSQTALRLTKGVHLVIPRSRLPISDAVVMPDLPRILFAIPWGERVILGTTDTDFQGDLSNPTCDEADMMYVLNAANQMFPTTKLERQDVVSTWAGLRPLVAEKSGAPSDISRRHEIQQAEPGWWDVTGGKLTTYRKMAEETVDQLVRFLGVKTDSCRTAVQPLLESAETTFSGIVSVEPGYPAVLHYCEHEWAFHLDDIMFRRTSWRHDRQNHLEIARQVANWMSTILSWDTDRLARELDQYQRMNQDHVQLVGTGDQT